MEDAEVKKVRNARRPTLQDVAGGEISLERYRASARAQSNARQPTLQDVENGEISLERYRASATGQSSARSNARRPTLRDVENGEISLEKYRASAQAQRNARQAPTLTPALKFKLVALGTELGEDAAEAATDRLFGWALSKLNLYKKLFPDGFLVNVGIGGAHTLKYGEMVPDFKGHVREELLPTMRSMFPVQPAGGLSWSQLAVKRGFGSVYEFLTSPEGLAIESSIEYVRFVPVVEVAESYTHFFLHDKRSGLADVAKLAVPPSSASDLPVWGCARLLSARLD